MGLVGKLASALGLHENSGELSKLSIRYETSSRHRYDGHLEVLFNPNRISTSKNVNWNVTDSAGKGVNSTYIWQQFSAVQPETLTIELFFDTYEGTGKSGPLSLGHAVKAALPTDPFAMALRTSPRAVSVVTYTDQVAALARVNRELHRPPICVLQWGHFQLMTGVLTALNQNFTMFMSDGTPVRATLTCTFTQYSDEVTIKSHDLHSADVAKSHVVSAKDTLQGIAASEYGDPTLWRHIAQANRIVNPLNLTVGSTLSIPPIVD